jgi:hypothetical protein
VRAAIIILGLMSENNPQHRKSMEHVAKFAILDSARLLQALQSVRTIEVPLRYGAIHRKKQKLVAANDAPRSVSDVQSEKACDHKDHDHYADDVEKIHCLDPIETCTGWREAWALLQDKAVQY